MATIFLTGATGLLGHYTLAALLSREGVTVRVLVSPPVDESIARLGLLLKEIGVDLASAIGSGRVSIVPGRLPDRLDPMQMAGVDTVLHAAASTRFHMDASGEPFRTNVNGTAALLGFAARAGVKHFVLVSTAYVGGLSSGVLPEDRLATCSPNANDYERSKWVAEQSVLKWSNRERRGVIVRPSILIGDLANGRSTTFGGVYILARAVELMARAIEHEPLIDRKRIPLRIMGRPESFLNISPVCWTALHLSAIASHPPDSPEIVNLVNPAPPSCDDVKRWLEAQFDLGGGRFTTEAWPWADATDFEEVFYAAGEGVHAYFRRDLHIETNFLSARGESGSLVNEAHFQKCINYARDRRWGRRAPTLTRASIPQGGDIHPAWYFEQFMASRLPTSSISRISGFTAIVRYIIDGIEDGEWVCRFQAGRMVELRRGRNSLHENFGFRVGRETFVRIVTGKQTIQSAYFQSEAEIFGDTLMAMKMVPIMDSFLLECPLPSG
ncbi:MAG: SDR family oxidoreductase [Phycisphaerae bacterium]|nr:SDR family oxidoreductase [Phycisphaerae bacterium]